MALTLISSCLCSGRWCDCLRKQSELTVHVDISGPMFYLPEEDGEEGQEGDHQLNVDHNQPHEENETGLLDGTLHPCPTTPHYQHLSGSQPPSISLPPTSVGLPSVCQAPTISISVGLLTASQSVRVSQYGTSQQTEDQHNIICMLNTHQDGPKGG